MLEKMPRKIGEALKTSRPGLDALTFNDEGLQDVDVEITVTSSAFTAGGPIPATYTADGKGISPPLEWNGVPTEAGSLVLIIEDADSPTPEPLVHAIVYDLPAGTAGLAEGALPGKDHTETGILMGRNSFLKAEYLPPDPPPGHGQHRYAFQLFALATRLNLGTAPGRSEIVTALREYAVAKGVAIGTYERR